MTNPIRILTLAAAATVWTTPAPADIVIYKNGRELKGIVERLPGNTTQILFRGAGIETRIPLAQIDRIVEEPRAQGFVHIGDEYRDRRDDLDQALRSYRQALEEDPAFETAKARIAATEAEILRRRQVQRANEIETVESAIARVREQIELGNFERAEKMVAEADELRPTEEQKTKLREVLIDLYVAWAVERIDKQDGLNAERKLDLALAIDPRNDKVIDMMLKLWEGNESKRSQSLRVYEMKLDLDPTNRLLRRQVGDLYYDMRMYREAAFHYLQLYELSPAEYRGSAFERKIVQTLDQLHSQYAVERNLDDAIYFFQLLRSIDPLAPEETIDYYEYLKEAEEKPGTDADAKIHLARFAEERQGLESFAIENYRGALELDPGNADARQAIDRYAMIWAQEAQRRFRDGNYFGVMAARERLEREFPNSSEAMLLVADLVTKAQIEIARVERSRAEEARRLVEQGDQDFERALGFYNNIFNVQTAGQISFSGAKNDAQRYFYYAIQSYQDAMAVDPALRTDPRSVVPRKITDANNYINRLTAGPPRTGGILPRRTQGRIPPPRP